MKKPQINVIDIEQDDNPLSEQTLVALEKLGAVLTRILLRLRTKGYDIIDGQVVKISDYNPSNEQKPTK